LAILSPSDLLMARPGPNSPLTQTLAGPTSFPFSSTHDQIDYL
jgi:hypothetical protein